MDLINGLAEASTWTGNTLRAVTPDTYDNPTPCAEWDVRALGNHVVGGAWLFAGAFAGKPVPTDAPGDLLGDDAHAAYLAAVEAMMASIAAPGALDAMAELPMGQVPGSFAASLALVDTLVHGWDLAKATGQPTDLPARLVDMVDTICRQSIGDSMRGPGMPFSQVVSVSDDAGPVERLTAFLGRS